MWSQTSASRPSTAAPHDWEGGAGRLLSFRCNEDPHLDRGQSCAPLRPSSSVCPPALASVPREPRPQPGGGESEAGCTGRRMAMRSLDAGMAALSEYAPGAPPGQGPGSAPGHPSNTTRTSWLTAPARSPFDDVITAEDVEAYKPSRRLRVRAVASTKPRHVLHVAFAWHIAGEAPGDANYLGQLPQAARRAAGRSE
jgi:hypothetical protein